MALVLTAVLCACVPLVGAFLFPAPSEGVRGGILGVPGWRFLAVGVTFGPILFSQSPFGEMEAATGKNWRQVELLVLLVNIVACVTLFTVTCWVTFNGPTALLILRGIVGWMGIALASGRILGWKAGWVGPLAVLPVVVYWGHGSTGYRWWDFTSLPPANPGSWVVVGCLAAFGATTYVFSKWRWRHLTNLVRRRIAAPAAAASKDRRVTDRTG
ncbi:hypothetical protein [Dactylosporangium sp. NPDC000521]|uniref:hypothetical protein n=1 Tax=Dactylosporangium sp. NPDC000521 TaxID=3363975 RepID=UPI0036B49265